MMREMASRRTGMENWGQPCSRLLSRQEREHVLLKLEAGAHGPNPAPGSYSPPAAWAYWRTAGGASSGRRSANTLNTAPEGLHHVQDRGNCRDFLLGKRSGQLAWLALLDQGGAWRTEVPGACA